ncbi:MAG: CPBP family intramembrane metalloprotease [Caldilineae bacterium]|nr:MAG: CPBP family intramembrane metalloprotease [Caldilineae bacterium]
MGVAVGLPLLLLLIGRGATAWLGLAAKPVLAQGNPVATFLMALVIALVANPWEEVGWRGFALPRLQARYNAFFASLVVGGMWAVWHLPLFFWPDNPMSETPFWRFALGTLASACLYTWLYNSANGSLFIVALHHVAWNTFGAVIGGVSGLAVTIVQWGMVLGLLAWFGAANLASRPRVVAGAHSYRANSS